MKSAAILVLLWPAFAGAQAPTVQPTPALRGEQRVERIRVEDAANRVDELRVGGETQTVVVQPRGGLPAWELQPADLARSRPGDRRDGAAGPRRVWNLLAF